VAEAASPEVVAEEGALRLDGEGGAGGAETEAAEEERTGEREGGREGEGCYHSRMWPAFNLSSSPLPASLLSSLPSSSSSPVERLRLHSHHAVPTAIHWERPSLPPSPPPSLLLPCRRQRRRVKDEGRIFLEALSFHVSRHPYIVEARAGVQAPGGGRKGGREGGRKGNVQKQSQQN